MGGAAVQQLQQQQVLQLQKNKPEAAQAQAKAQQHEVYVARRKSESVSRRRSIGEASRVEEEAKESEESGPALFSSAEELAALLGRTDAGQWKEHAADLVRNISTEISRILAYDDEAADADTAAAAPPSDATAASAAGAAVAAGAGAGAAGAATAGAEAAGSAPAAGAKAAAGSAAPSPAPASPPGVPALANESESEAKVDLILDAIAREAALGGDLLSDEGELDSLLSYLSESLAPGDQQGGQQPLRARALTPYDVWKRSRGRESTSKKAPRYSEAEWAKVVARLGQYQLRRDLRRMSAQHRVLREELSSLKFRPEICARSRRTAAGIKPLPERLEAVVALRKEHVEGLRKQVEAAEMAEVTLQPKTNKGGRWKPVVSHSILLKGRGEVTEADAELTFSPVLNKRSARLAEAAARMGRRTDVTMRRAPKPVPQEAPPTFQPSVNKPARRDGSGAGSGSGSGSGSGAGAAPEDQEPVYERLYKKLPQHVAARGSLRRHLRDPVLTGAAAGGAHAAATNVVPFVEEKHAFLRARVPIA